MSILKPHKRKTAKSDSFRSKLILMEFAIYTVLLGVILCFPFQISHFECYSAGICDEPQYISTYYLAYAYIVFYFWIVSSYLSGRKLLHLVSLILSGIFILLLVFITLLGQTWSGGPYKPTFGIAFWLIHFFLLLVLIRTLILREHASFEIISKKWRTFSTIISIAMPSLGVIAWFILLYLAYTHG